MFTWIAATAVTVIVLGWVAYKFPTLFNKTVAQGAAVVNSGIDQAKAAAAPAVAKAEAAVANAVVSAVTKK